MSTRKYGIIAQAVLLAVFAALLAAGSVYDGLIAEKLYTGKGIITVTTEAIGKMPLFLAAAFACAAAFFTVRRPDSVRSMTAAEDGEAPARAAGKERGAAAWYIIRKVVYCLGGVACASFMFKDVFDMITSELLMSLAMCGMAGVAVFTLLTIVFPRISAKKLQSWKKWAIATIIAALIIVVLTEGVKLLWGRARPYEVWDGAEFTAWYTISSFGGDSFFSGHAACCAGILMFAPLLWINDDEPIYRIIYSVLAVLFIACSMLGRIMSGDHYLTDVAAGAIISTVVMSVTYGIAFFRGYEAKPDGFIYKYL